MFSDHGFLMENQDNWDMIYQVSLSKKFVLFNFGLLIIRLSRRYKGGDLVNTGNGQGILLVKH